jgi:hypothetical protein
MAEAVGLMRVTTPDELNRRDKELAAISAKALEGETFRSQLANFIHNAFERARRHQESEGIRQSLVDAMRIYRGQYSPEKLREISTFSGSKVYARLTAVKCRGATAILRDIYLSSHRPWRVDPTPEPTVPGDVAAKIMSLVQVEVQTLQATGQPIDPQAVEDRVRSLMDGAKKAERRVARREADKAALKLEDHLREGGFYKALSQLLVDLPIFPYACMKGPVIRKETSFRWLPDGNKELVEAPKMFWERVSPFDLYFSPGASEVEHSTIMERIRLTRDELYDLIGLPGYDEDAIRRVMETMRSGSSGLSTWMNYFEAERAQLERREHPNFDSEHLFIDALEFNGFVRGQWLRDWGVSDREVPDAEREYFVTCWLIDSEVIKVQVNPNPRQRPNYYITSFEKVPGSLSGHALPDILNDIQEVVNATLRALVNNLAISSGPQVIVDDDRIAIGADSDSLYPWKRWHVTTDPLAGAGKPVDFFQPSSNANELLSVYKEFTNMADEISAIPRYLTGSQRTGGAAATASGLAMLMGNASKVMQNVAANVDEDIIEPALQLLYDLVMLTDPGALRGDENIVVRGVSNSIQREQDRMRQLEFLNLTANPIDMQIIGPRGRAGVLRAVAENLGLEYEDIVAEDEQIQQMLEQQSLQQTPEGDPNSKPNPQQQTPLTGQP